MTPNDWRKLIEKERAQRDALIKGGEDAVDSRRLREWWATIEKIFRAMVTPSGKFTGELPMELFKVVSGLAGYLAVGQIPQPMSDVRVRGRTAPGPSEKRHIQTAVTYREAVRRGLIQDSNPTKTIAEAFGLRSARTVQEWCKNFSPLDLKMFLHFPETLEKQLKDHGEVYKRANARTWDAIKKARNRRRARK